MKHLLIGGTGFIGSALSTALLQQGEDVVLVSHTPENPTPQAQLVQVNLYETACPQTLLDESDRVFILIGQVHPGFDKAKELATLRTLLQGLQQSRAHVFYFSTVHIYGEAPTPAREDTPGAPLDDYGQFKLEAERLMQDMLPPERWTIFRLTNIYGSPKNRGLIGLLMRKLAEPEPNINLNGNGEQRRDYLFLDDLIQAILTIQSHPRPQGIVNIATGTTHSLIEVVELVSEVAGKPIAYHITHQPIAEAQDCLIDATRLQEAFGYTSFTPLKEGLRLTLERYQTMPTP